MPKLEQAISEEFDEMEELGENIQVDLNNLDDLPDFEESEFDSNADAFERLPLPQPGTYQFSVELSERGVTIKKTTRGESKAYYSVPFVLTLVSDDETIAGAKIYPTLSTIIGVKRTSTLLSFLKECGIKPKDDIVRMGHKNQLVMLNEFLRSNPKVWVQVDQEVAYADTEKGRSVYKTMYPSYASLPNQTLVNGDGTKKTVKKTEFEKNLSDGSVARVRARLKVIKYIGLNKASGKRAVAVGSPLLTTKSIEELESELT